MNLLIFLILWPYPQASCPSGWTYYSGTHSCYSIQKGTQENSVAENLCRDQRAYLTSIHSGSENTFINGIVQQQTGSLGLWIELYRIDPPNGQFWGNFDGTPTDYFNWDKGQPDNDHHKKACVLMLSNGKWNDGQCSTAQPISVCKKPAC